MICQRRLAEAQRAGEEDVVESLVPPLRGLERDSELLLIRSCPTKSPSRFGRSERSSSTSSGSSTGVTTLSLTGTDYGSARMAW